VGELSGRQVSSQKKMSSPKNGLSKNRPTWQPMPIANSRRESESVELSLSAEGAEANRGILFPAQNLLVGRLARSFKSQLLEERGHFIVAATQECERDDRTLGQQS
jgi:hypothetical protein